MAVLDESIVIDNDVDHAALSGTLTESEGCTGY